MISLKEKTGTYMGCLLAGVLLVASQAALAQGNSGNNGNSHGKNKNVGVGNASDGIKASIVTDKRIYYSGDPLVISVRVDRGGELISSGEIDASVVIFSPAEAEEETDTETDMDTDADAGALTDAIVMPITVDPEAETLKLFEMESVDISALPAGTYQLGLILTKPDGDPLVINDWYRGLLGLEDIVGLTITADPVDFDDDGDGMVDNDEDGDGFSDDDPEEETTE